MDLARGFPWASGLPNITINTRYYTNGSKRRAEPTLRFFPTTPAIKRRAHIALRFNLKHHIATKNLPSVCREIDKGCVVLAVVGGTAVFKLAYLCTPVLFH